ncbi:sulfotransferase family 2 domain-containing protein [Amaricoccus macauensis]|uniref:sulfotransferase family 2 domain-containing protein n=1 Tax=Amaricoccus macauensis TaxID=57001 RepID=UPI003C7D3B9E
MPLARIGSTLLFFVHVPKTGGTSIESYLRTKGPLGLAGTRHGWSRTTPQHIHADIHGELVPPGLYDHGFAVIRDPKARLLSEFKMRAEPLRFKPRPIGLARLAGYKAKGKAAYGIRLRHRIDYFDFDDWVTRVFDEYRRDPFYKDNHMRPQAQFVSPGLRLFRFEDGLDRVFRWIDEVTGTAPSSGEFFERRSAPMEISCSPETDELIREFYREDYDLIESLEWDHD